MEVTNKQYQKAGKKHGCLLNIRQGGINIEVSIWADSVGELDKKVEKFLGDAPQSPEEGR